MSRGIRPDLVTLLPRDNFRSEPVRLVVIPRDDPNQFPGTCVVGPELPVPQLPRGTDPPRVELPPEAGPRIQSREIRCPSLVLEYEFGEGPYPFFAYSMYWLTTSRSFHANPTENPTGVLSAEDHATTLSESFRARPAR